MPEQAGCFQQDDNMFVAPPQQHEDAANKEGYSSYSDSSLDTIAKAGGFNILDMNLTFPVKLHMLLSFPACHEYLEWCSHGRAWKIIRPKPFEALVLPRFFRSAKHASFMRQVSLKRIKIELSIATAHERIPKATLNLKRQSNRFQMFQVNGWAFSRITEGPDVNAYWHPLFLRGLPTLAAKMRRPPKEKNSAASARSSSGASVESSPNFRLISKFAPLPPNTPYRITAGGRIQPIDPVGAKRAETEFLDLGSDDEFLRELKTMGWANPQPIEKNPFDSDSHDSDGGRKQAVAGEAKHEGKGVHSSPETMDAFSSKQQSLSEVDLRYLANQNRYLLMYAAQNQQDEQSSASVAATFPSQTRSSTI
jgi:HSF-type DNA-binding